MTRVNIAGLDRAEIIAALYNASQPLGMGFLHYDPAPMTRDEAQAYLDVDLYDRDNGRGAAERAIDSLRKKAA